MAVLKKIRRDGVWKWTVLIAPPSDIVGQSQSDEQWSIWLHSPIVIDFASAVDIEARRIHHNLCFVEVWCHDNCPNLRRVTATITTTEIQEPPLFFATHVSYLLSSIQPTTLLRPRRGAALVANTMVQQHIAAGHLEVGAQVGDEQDADFYQHATTATNSLLISAEDKRDFKNWFVDENDVSSIFDQSSTRNGAAIMGEMYTSSKLAPCSHCLRVRFSYSSPWFNLKPCPWMFLGCRMILMTKRVGQNKKSFGNLSYHSW